MPRSRLVFRKSLEGPPAMVNTRDGQGDDTDAAPAAGAPCQEAMWGIAEFTPEQWRWLQAQSKPFEDGYQPTRPLIPGL
ncbi:hypothetical protein ASD53_09315 [Lysobacter sp. Root559]|nr:hypothetical protein ASD53_09315 [Lysobacter sp. Root559]